MVAQSKTGWVDASHAAAVNDTATYVEGIRAGVAGAAAIALWFLVVDLYAGRPFYTPTVLGHAVFNGTTGLAGVENVEPSLELVLGFTWIHGLSFLLLGLLASRLLALADRDPNYGFGILLLFVVFEVGFVFVCMLAAEPILHALTLRAILVGNLLAAGAMAVVFRRHRESLTALP
jgi:hypothetical protein